MSNSVKIDEMALEAACMKVHDVGELRLGASISKWLRPIILAYLEAARQQTVVGDYVRIRLAQIASGDYRACGHTAEEVAADALKALTNNGKTNKC